ncbi:MAG: hypothetical protein ACRYFS_10780 [Janthinobacterium lividum]
MHSTPTRKMSRVRRQEKRRRRQMPVLLVSAMFSAAGLSLAALPPTQAQGTPATDRNVKAQAFSNTFGANVHLGEGSYQNTQAIADALNIIGFSRIRIKCTDAADVAAAKDVAAKAAPYFPNGLKANVIVIGYLNAPDDTLVSQKKAIPQLASIIETIEGPNEINNYSTGNGTHGPFDLTDQTKNFGTNYAAWSKALFAWKKSNPTLAQAKLMAPDIASGDPDDYTKLPNISPYVDSGNFHFYAGNGRQPSNFGGGNFSAIYNWYKSAASPTKPISVSEWGQTTAVRPGQGGCDTQTQAKYILNQMFDMTSRGVYRAYLYQLMDDTDGDPNGTEGTEAHFGIFDYQWKVKPAAQALANVKNLLADKPAVFTARVPNYRVSGVTNAGAAGSSLSISKSDGSTFIVVWNEPQIWDQKAFVAVTPPDNIVTIEFGGNYTYKVYDPLVGLGATAAGSSTTVRVNVIGSPIMIQVFPH